MKDPFASTGNITGATTGNISLGGNNREFQLMQHIEKITEIVHRQESEIRRLQGLVSQSDFSDQELKFLLSRCHPDKNPDSKASLELTKKLNLLRKK